MVVLSGLPLPRMTLVAGGPLPVFAAFIPGMPRARLTGATDGPLRLLMGLSGVPRRTAEGCWSLFTTDAACGCARLTATGAAIAMIRFGAAGMRIGLGWSILTTGCFGNSGIFTLGMTILGSSTLASSGSGFGLGGAIFGLTGSGFFWTTGSVSTVSLFVSSMICLGARLSTMTTNAMATLTSSEVTVEALLWAPVSRTPK